LAVGLFVAAGSARGEDAIARCIAATDKGLDLRKQGKLLEARKALASCAVTACGTEIKETCEKRIAEINAALPTVIFAAKDGSGNDLSRVTVWMDGAKLADSLEGQALTIDPGKHAFKFEAAGLPAVQKELVLRETEKGRREQVVLGSSPHTARAASTASLAASPSPDVGASSGAWSSQKTLALVAGGVGVAGIAVGSIFGLSAKKALEDQQAHCSTSSCGAANYQAAQSDHDSATSAALVSDIAFGLGAVGVVAGAVLWFTAPGGAATSQGTGWQIGPRVSAGGGGVSIAGRFQ
jgi:hypothetical protein